MRWLRRSDRLRSFLKLFTKWTGRPNVTKVGSFDECAVAGRLMAAAANFVCTPPRMETGLRSGWQLAATHAGDSFPTTRRNALRRLLEPSTTYRRGCAGTGWVAGAHCVAEAPGGRAAFACGPSADRIDLLSQPPCGRWTTATPPPTGPAEAAERVVGRHRQPLAEKAVSRDSGPLRPNTDQGGLNV